MRHTKDVGQGSHSKQQRQCPRFHGPVSLEAPHHGAPQHHSGTKPQEPPGMCQRRESIKEFDQRGGIVGVGTGDVRSKEVLKGLAYAPAETCPGQEAQRDTAGCENEVFHDAAKGKGVEEMWVG